MRKVLICGAGMSATDLISYMLKCAEEYDWEIIVGDISVETAESKIGGHPRGRAVYFDCYDNEIMDQHIRGCVLLVSLLPPGMHAAAAKIALKYNVHVVTASYASTEMMGLHEEAKAKGLTFLNELGADPGIDHMSAMRSIDNIRVKGGIITSFSSYCGSLVSPESNDNPWHYKFTWSPKSIITMGDGGAQYFENNRLRCIPYYRVFENPETISIPGFQSFEAYPNRDSTPYRSKYGLDDVPTLIRATLRYPGFCGGWNTLVKLGLTANNYTIPGSENLTYREWVEAYLTCTKPQSAEEALAKQLSIDPGSRIYNQLEWAELLTTRQITRKNGTPAEILLDLFMDKLKFKEGDIDMLVFYERLEYELEEEPREHIAYLVTRGLDKLHTAISRTVGLPAAIGAKLILNGDISSRGILFPWTKEVYEPVLKELDSLDIAYSIIDRKIQSESQLA